MLQPSWLYKSKLLSRMGRWGSCICYQFRKTRCSLTNLYNIGYIILTTL